MLVRAEVRFIIMPPEIGFVLHKKVLFCARGFVFGESSLRDVWVVGRGFFDRHNCT